MKSLLSLCAVAGSALVAGSTFSNAPHTAIPNNTSFFTCHVNGKAFTAIANDSSLATQFTYADGDHTVAAALFVDAEKKENNGSSGFYIQPLKDDAPAAPLTANNNLYRDFYITYKAPDNTFYNTTDAPGNLEITSIDAAHKLLNGKLNCVLYNSTKGDWMIVTNGRFRLKY